MLDETNTSSIIEQRDLLQTKKKTENNQRKLAQMEFAKWNSRKGIIMHHWDVLSQSNEKIPIYFLSLNIVTLGENMMRPVLVS